MGAREPHTELAALDGGGLRNAIPREAKATLSSSCSAADWAADLAELTAAIRLEYRTTDPDLAIHFHEVGAPIWSWLNMLIAVALVRVAPAGRLLRAVKAYRVVSYLVLLGLLIPFAVGQIRVALYPQL